jgi:hypothetical protein
MNYINENARRPHHHDRGSDRVLSPAQEVRRHSARGAPTFRASPRRSSARSVRTRTSSSSVKCAIWKRSRPPSQRGRDGPLGVWHAPHQQRRQDGRPHRRRLPGQHEGHDPHAALDLDHRGVISQVALQKESAGGRIAAYEIMVNTTRRSPRSSATTRPSASLPTSRQAPTSA